MMQYLLETGLTNALLVTVLAVLVWGITRLIRHPLIVSILWMAVLIKLVTPSMFAYAIPWPGEPSTNVTVNQVASIPVPTDPKLPLHHNLPPYEYRAEDFKALELYVYNPKDFQPLLPHYEEPPETVNVVPQPANPPQSMIPNLPPSSPFQTIKLPRDATELLAKKNIPDPDNPFLNQAQNVNHAQNVALAPYIPLQKELQPVIPITTNPNKANEKQQTFWSQPRLWMGIWLVGSFVWLTLILFRSWKFGKLVRMAEQEHEVLQSMTDNLSERIGLRWKPPVRVVEAEIAPMIWAYGRQTLILFPKHFLEELTIEKQQMVLAHELAHLKRRDHQLRWLELLVLSLYWWLPTVRFVRRQLHNAQEECCDAWVLQLFPEQQVQYGETLLSAATLLGQVRKVPLLASEFGQKQSLKTRVESMLKNHNLRPLSRFGLLSCLLVVGLMLAVSVRWGEADEKLPREEITNNNQQTEKELVESITEVKKQIEEAKEKLERQLPKKRENISGRADDDDDDDRRRGGRGLRGVSKLENSYSGDTGIDSILDPVLETLDHENEEIRLDAVRILGLYVSDQRDRITQLAREKGIERQNIKLDEITQKRFSIIESILHSIANTDTSNKIRSEASRYWFVLASLAKTPRDYYEFVWKTRLELMIDAPEDWQKLISYSGYQELELESTASIPNAFNNLIWSELDEKKRAEKKNKLLVFLLEQTLQECHLFLKDPGKVGISFDEHVSTFDKVESYFNSPSRSIIPFVKQCAIPSLSTSPEFIDQIIKTADNCSEEDRVIYANLLAKIAEHTNHEMKTKIINRYIKSKHEEFRRAMINTLRNTFKEEKISLQRGAPANPDFKIRDTSSMSRREREDYEEELQQSLASNTNLNPTDLRNKSAPNLAPLKRLLNDPDPEVRALAKAQYQALAPKEDLIIEVFARYKTSNPGDNLAATAKLFHWLENYTEVDSKNYQEELTKRITLLELKLTYDELHQLFGDLFILGQKQLWSIEELGEFYPGTLSYLQDLGEKSPENALRDDNEQTVLNRSDQSSSSLLTKHIQLNPETKTLPLVGEVIPNLFENLTSGKITSLPINKLLEHLVKTSPVFLKIAADFAYKTENPQDIKLISDWIEKCSSLRDGMDNALDHAMRSRHPQIRAAAIKAFSNSIRASEQQKQNMEASRGRGIRRGR